MYLHAIRNGIQLANRESHGTNLQHWQHLQSEHWPYAQFDRQLVRLDLAFAASTECAEEEAEAKPKSE